MFFQYRDIDADSGKQIAEHHAGRTTADDAAGGSDVWVCGVGVIDIEHLRAVGNRCSLAYRRGNECLSVTRTVSRFGRRGQ